MASESVATEQQDLAKLFLATEEALGDAEERLRAICLTQHAMECCIEAYYMLHNYLPKCEERALKNISFGLVMAMERFNDAISDQAEGR